MFQQSSVDTFPIFKMVIPFGRRFFSEPQQLCKGRANLRLFPWCFCPFISSSSILEVPQSTIKRGRFGAMNICQRWFVTYSMHIDWRKGVRIWCLLHSVAVLCSTTYIANVLYRWICDVIRYHIKGITFNYQRGDTCNM